MTPEEVFEKYNENKVMGFDSFQKVTYSGGHNQWITKYPKVNTVIRQLRDALNDNVIDFNWITDHFGGNVSQYVTGITQEEASKLGKIQSISWKDFIKDREVDYNTFDMATSESGFTPEKYKELEEKVMFLGEWNEYRKPQAIDYMTAKDLKAHKLDLDTVEPHECNPAVNTKSVKLREFLLNEASFRTISKTQFNIFTSPDETFNGGIFARNGKLKSNEPKEVGEFLFQLSYNENEFKKDTDAIAKLWEWRTKRNEKRSILEEAFGYDTKHAAHLVRLLLGAQNILREGVYRPRLKGKDLELVRDTLAGKFTYEEVLAMSIQFEKDLEPLYESTNLPHTANHKKANELLLDLSRSY